METKEIEDARKSFIQFLSVVFVSVFSVSLASMGVARYYENTSFIGSAVAGLSNAVESNKTEAQKSVVRVIGNSSSEQSVSLQDNESLNLVGREESPDNRIIEVVEPLGEQRTYQGAPEIYMRGDGSQYPNSRIVVGSGRAIQGAANSIRKASTSPIANSNSVAPGNSAQTSDFEQLSENLEESTISRDFDPGYSEEMMAMFEEKRRQACLGEIAQTNRNPEADVNKARAATLSCQDFGIIL